MQTGPDQAGPTIIKRAVFSDLKAIQSLQARSIKELSGPHYNAAQIQSLVVTQTVSICHFLPLIGSQIYVTLDATRPSARMITGMGYLMNNCPIISGLFVHPSFARQRIGTHILQHLEKIARRRSYPSLLVTASLMAVPFYRSAGYEVQQSYQINSLGQPIDCKLMTKSF